MGGLGKRRRKGKTQNRTTTQIGVLSTTDKENPTPSTDKEDTIILNSTDPEVLNLIEGIAQGLVEVPRKEITDIFRTAYRDMNDQLDSAGDIAEIQVALIIIMFADAIEVGELTFEEARYFNECKKSFTITKPLLGCDVCISKICPVAVAGTFLQHSESTTKRAPCPIEIAWTKICQLA